jgi:cytochrome P450
MAVARKSEHDLPGPGSLSGPKGRIRSTVRLMRAPHATYAAWRAQFGKTYLVKALNGNVVVTSNTENIRRILAARHDEISQFAVGTVSPLIGEHSVLIVNGERHKRARSLLNPAFQGEALRGSVATMQAIADRVGRNWRPGDRIRVMDFSLEFSLEVIIQVVFGVQEPDQVETFKRAIQSWAKSFLPVFAFTSLVQHRFVPQWNRFLAEKKKFGRLLDEQISRRRSDGRDNRDILGILLQATDEQGNALQNDELRDQLTTLLFAGHETTQIAIAWAMSWLHRNPGILERLVSELETASTASEILESGLLEGVCMESLRLNPIVPDFLRVFEEPIDLLDVRLPARSNVGILTSVVHYDPEIYADPERFDPDRWMDRPCKPWEFLAFGGGVRRCIGAGMAVLEMKIVLASWLRRFEFRLPADAPKIELIQRRNLTLAPRSGIELIVDRARVPDNCRLDAAVAGSVP